MYFRYSSLLFAVRFVILTLLFNPSHGSGTKDCEDFITNAFYKRNAPFLLGNVGKYFLKEYMKTGFGYVYSDVIVHQKLIQLLPLLSSSGKKILKGYLGLKDDEVCKGKYCESYNSIIDDIIKRQKGDLSHQTSLLYMKGKTLQNWDNLQLCFTNNIPVNFTDESKSVHIESSNAYETVMNRSEVDFNPETDFYLLGGIEISPSIFKDNKWISSNHKFTDIDGEQQTVKWVKVSGESWVINKKEGSLFYKVFRIKINERGLFMVYFMPLTTQTVIDSINDLNHIFSDLHRCVNEGLNMNKNNGATEVSSLAVPYINMTSKIDLEKVFNKRKFFKMNKIFKTGKIQGLYENETTTLKDFGTVDYFKNLNSMPPHPIDIAESNTEFVDSNFAFVVVDAPSSMILKTGFFFRAEKDK